MRGYFMKYQSAQTHIASILAALASGKDELLMDNAAIDTERANMWKTMGRLEQMIHISKRSEEHTSELQSLMRISYAVFCLKKKKQTRRKKNDKKQERASKKYWT